MISIAPYGEIVSVSTRAFCAHAQDLTKMGMMGIFLKEDTSAEHSLSLSAHTLEDK